MPSFEDIVVGSWSDARQSLEPEGEVPAVPLQDNGKYSQGDFRLLDEDPDIPCIFFPSATFPGDQDIPVDMRNPGGFHFRNAEGHPVELKYRFSDELRKYPEQIHTHNVPELYIADGQFEMSLASDYDDGRPIEFRDVEIEDEAFIVPAGMYHGITWKEDGSNLVVARGDPSHREEYVGKWDVDGQQLYSHLPTELNELPGVVAYREGDDEMYRV